MPIKIEQITKTGLVVSDYDNKLSVKAMATLLSKHSDLKIISNKNPYQAIYKGKNINLCIANITYLGIPHPHYKKRIQIKKPWADAMQKNNTLILGVYSYGNDFIFCLFNAKTYKNNKANNSAAHLCTMDILKAKELGIYDKTDIRNNEITTFTEDKFIQVFDKFVLKTNLCLSNEIQVFQDFSKTINTHWLGVNCYDEMLRNNCNNVKQNEWAGFYLEYKFDKFLNENPRYKKYCQYMPRKSKEDIDLDLWFKQNKFLGDLKAHTIGGGLLGNDKFNAYEAVRLHGKFWYISFNHTTEKDVNHGAEVMKKWNAIRCKDSMGYLNRMKYSVNLKSFYILEVSNINLKYLKAFNQGKNSNGKPRSAKISIKPKDLKNDNFAIYRQNL